MLVCASPAVADYDAGRRAWNAGRHAEALTQWRAAANGGDSRAMLALGRLYLKGVGAPQDYVLAHMWFNLAASLGERRAAGERDALAARMTAAERSEAQKRARAWRAERRGAAPEPLAERRPAARPAPPPPRAVREAQRLLAALGYAPGPADGVWGDRAARAYRAFTRDAGGPVSGRLTPEGLRALRRAADARPAAEPRAPRRAADGSRDLLRAARDGDIDGMRRALGAGADPDRRDRRGWTALMHAANAGYTLLVPPLLEARADPDLRAADGATALFMAVLRGHGEIAAMLVRAGADASIAGPRGRTPLEVARLRKLGGTFALLERAGADRAAFQSALRADTVEAYRRYLAANPRGLFAEEAGRRRDAGLDRAAFARAAKAGTARAYRAYLARHPEGRHRADAEARAAALETEDFERAAASGTAAAYRRYLAVNPEGAFAEEARRRAGEALDREAFARARAARTIDSYKAYLAAHPRGSHVAEARAAIEALGDPLAFARAKSMNTVEAWDAYLARYPEGAHAGEARTNRALVGSAGRVFRDCEGCPAMVVLPPGSFTMGSAAGELDERPPHRVTFAGVFAVGKHEVTFAEFALFVRETGHDMAEDRKGFLGLPAAESCGSYRRLIDSTISWRSPGYPQEDGSPAVCVSWNDAASYAKWLARRTGKPYRLPSEAEWEYAARAGTAGAFHFGARISTKQANFNSSHDDALAVDRGNRRRAVPVGSFAANTFGLHDMHGNVLEWVADCWHDDYAGAPADGSAWTRDGDCGTRVARGGSWLNPASYLRSAFRTAMEPDKRFTHFGFRVARPVAPKAAPPEARSPREGN